MIDMDGWAPVGTFGDREGLHQIAHDKERWVAIGWFSALHGVWSLGTGPFSEAPVQPTHFKPMSDPPPVPKPEVKVALHYDRVEIDLVPVGYMRIVIRLGYAEYDLLRSIDLPTRDEIGSIETGYVLCEPGE